MEVDERWVHIEEIVDISDLINLFDRLEVQPRLCPVLIWGFGQLPAQFAAVLRDQRLQHVLSLNPTHVYVRRLVHWLAVKLGHGIYALIQLPLKFHHSAL